MEADPRPEVRWAEYDLPGVSGGHLTHDPEPCVFVDGQCPCGRLDLGVVRADDYDVFETGPWTEVNREGWVRIEGGTLDLAVVRDRAAAWPTYRWWKRFLPRRWWPIFGYQPLDMAQWIEAFDRGSK